MQQVLAQTPGKIERIILIILGSEAMGQVPHLSDLAGRQMAYLLYANIYFFYYLYVSDLYF